MSERFVKAELVEIPDFCTSDKTKWLELKKKYLAQEIPAIIVRGLPELSRQAIFDLGGIEEHSTAETAIAVNHDYTAPFGHVQTKDLGLHFDGGKNISGEATTNRVEIGRIGVSLIEGTPAFTATWGTDLKRHPQMPKETAEAYDEGLIDTTVFTPVIHAGEVGPSDALLSRNYSGNVLAHDVRTLTQSRLSFMQGVLLVD